ncbi:hypothetical protein U9M48_033421 [Paspalum notatum var. saurae]|uniref:Uncharacterized protein n=1 Tax=Paspalum notatum var. saurae TaxID=547442 RepID=A0AAQ3UBA1_PASNO
MGSNNREHRHGVPRPPPLSLYRNWEEEEVIKADRTRLSPSVQSISTTEVANNTNKKRLSKQLSMKETTREVKWEKRRRQIQRQRSNRVLNDGAMVSVSNICPLNSEVSSSTERVAKRLTDEDLDELRGSMDLGFGFNEKKGGLDLCDTLPALDLYFAINRKLSEPNMQLPTSSVPSLSTTKSSPNLCSTPSPRSPSAHSNPMDSWKICSPGDNPQLVKTRLRHWAQVVACSVKHSS